MEGYYETAAQEREIWLNEIYKNVKKKKIDINLALGSEIYMSENIIKLLEEGKASTINNTSYVLFEMPLNIEPFNLYDVIYKMEQNKIVPILAHPERYSFIQKEPELVYDLIEKGVLMQANYGSIIGQYGSKAKMIVKKFYENNMIHFLGTDVHRQNTIYKKVPEIIEILKDLIGEEKVIELTEINPTLALNNKRINIEQPNSIELTLKEKFILNFKRK